jgi:hypothetical protein
MNDKNKLKFDKKEFNVKVKGQANKKYTLKITDEDLDIKDKKDGEEIDIKATLKEEKETTETPVTLKGKVNKGLYRDSVSVNKTDSTTLTELESEIKPYSRIWTKPATIITGVAILLVVVGGI